MNLLEVCRKIKTNYVDRDNIKCFLISRFQGPVEDNVQVCIKVEDDFIALSAFPIILDDMLASDWELRIVYKH